MGIEQYHCAVEQNIIYKEIQNKTQTGCFGLENTRDAGYDIDRSLKLFESLTEEIVEHNLVTFKPVDQLLRKPPS